jgi:hypothetical protein
LSQTPNPKIQDVGEKMFPTSPYPKNSLSQILGFGSDSDPKEYFLGKKLAQTKLWESFWDRLAENWCQTNINDFKHSINRPSARHCQQDRSRNARLLLVPCSRAARARSTSRSPRVAPALRAPALRAPALRAPAVRSLAARAPIIRTPAVRAPALRAPKMETQGTAPRTFLAWRHRTQPRLLEGGERSSAGPMMRISRFDAQRQVSFRTRFGAQARGRRSTPGASGPSF